MKDTTDNKTFDIYEAIQNGIGLDPTALAQAKAEIAMEEATMQAKPATAKRPGRPPKNGKRAMSAAERQKQYRRRNNLTAIGAIREDISDLSLSQLMTKLSLLASQLKSPNNTMPDVTQEIISDTLDELRRRLVDLPI